MNIAEDALDVAAKLDAAGINATANPRTAAGSTKPVVLVAPPSRDYTQAMTVYTLVVLAGRQDPDLETLKLHAALVQQLEESPYPVESAEPGQYQLMSEQPPSPCYLVRITGGI